MDQPMYNPKHELFCKFVLGKRVAVLGLGVSNLPIIETLNKCGAIVIGCDKRTEDQFDPKVLEKLKKFTKKLYLGNGYLEFLDDQHIIFRTPGIHPDTTQLVKARENGAMVTSEMEMFLSACPCPVIGVTGSDGKTTTTTIIYEMLKTDGYDVLVGGNIGTPLCDQLEFIDPSNAVVLELSSFQLMDLGYSPEIAVVTNVEPNHLDYHKDMEEYIEAKKHIFKYQTPGGRLVLNADNEITNAFEQEAVGSVIKFSLRSRPEHGAYVKGDTIYYDTMPIMKITDIRLPGLHNVANYLAAIAAVYDLVEPSTIVKVAKTFRGVKHRLELVREYRGVKFYNDSIASSPTRTIAGLKSFSQKVILIAGGYDKKIPFDGFGEVVLEKVKALILMGATANKIQREVESHFTEDESIPILHADDMEYAVKAALAIADRRDCVLLSPACASFDMYKNFEERGDAFKQIVMSLGAEKFVTEESR